MTPFGAAIAVAAGLAQARQAQRVAELERQFWHGIPPMGKFTPRCSYCRSASDGAENCRNCGAPRGA